MAGRLAQVEAKAAEAPAWLAHIAAAATVIVTAVTASFGPLGVAVGSATFFRNSAVPFYLAICACAVALFLVGAAYLQGADAANRGRKNLYALLALTAIAVAIVFGALAIARAGAADHGPEISASVSAEGVLTGEVTVAGLSGGQRLHVRVLEIRGVVDSVLQEASIGPSAEGVGRAEIDLGLDLAVVDGVRIEAWVPTWLWWVENPECAETREFFEEDSYACLELPIESTLAPVVTLRFEETDGNRSLSGSISAVPASKEFLHVVVIDVESGVVLYETAVSGQAGRPIVSTIDVTVGEEHRSVCALGELLTSLRDDRVPECPTTAAEKGWVLIRSARVPSEDESGAPEPSLPSTSSSTPSPSQTASP